MGLEEHGFMCTAKTALLRLVEFLKREFLTLFSSVDIFGI